MLSFFELVYSNDLGYFFLHAFGRGVFLCAGSFHLILWQFM